MRRVKVNLNGEEVEGEELDWSVVADDWSRYKTEDGALLKQRHVVTRVVRLNKRDGSGAPIYQVFTTPVTVVQVEPHLVASDDIGNKNN